MTLKGTKFTEEHKQKLSISKLGRKHSDEHRENIRLAKTGVVMSENIRKKMSEAHKGIKSHFWKGGVTPINIIIRESLEYRLWREAVFKRDNYTCLWCGDDRGGNLEADHIKPFSLYPALRLAIDNGRTLCHECHKKTDTYGFRANIKN